MCSGAAPVPGAVCSGAAACYRDGSGAASGRGEPGPCADRDVPVARAAAGGTASYFLLK